MYKRIPFRAKNGKANLKKKTEKIMWGLGFSRDHLIIRGDYEGSDLYEQKLHNLGNYIPKICCCSRDDVRKEFDI